MSFNFKGTTFPYDPSYTSRLGTFGSESLGVIRFQKQL